MLIGTLNILIINSGNPKYRYCIVIFEKKFKKIVPKKNQPNIVIKIAIPKNISSTDPNSFSDSTKYFTEVL